ncbi:MAG: TetR family transcriptional regulator [Chroococcidiopsidaceae cyanobacterium CP_BM_ER_R8_30]|nr:TetR family transcriptional regulator [Chroococcidiopsidaceae cyanobacterium CP_BM_ER_R8_30]
MSSPRTSTRQRIIHAALELFAAQGVTETTTRQIAELAQVNEVTLFRQFGNKHGLLLAVIEDSALFTYLGESLVEPLHQTSSFDQALKDYASGRLQALERVPEFVRSVVGEAGQYPLETRQALGRGLTQANCYVAQYLASVIQERRLHTPLPAEKLASLLNCLLLGYAVIEFTSEFHELWKDRADFLESLVTLFLPGSEAPLPIDPASSTSLPVMEQVADLPANLVHSILQRAKKQGLRDYAMVYILFGAGLFPEEIVALERSHFLSDVHQHLLQVTQRSGRGGSLAQGAVRQVPLNHWILGKRYGSHTRNPLSQWLKSRRDSQSALLLNDAGQPLSVAELHSRWQILMVGLLTPIGQPPVLGQARQTWCVEMLMRGISLEDLSIISGWNSAQLQPYARRAREKAAIERAVQLDQKAQ